MQLLIESIAAPFLPFFPALADAALKGIVLLGAITLTMPLLRRTSADARHLGWLCGIIGLLILPIGSALLPDWRALPAWPAMPTLRPAPVAALPANLSPLPLARIPVIKGEVFEEPFGQVFEGSPATTAIAQKTPAHLPRAQTWLLLAWSAGAVFCAARLLVGHVRLHLARRRADPLTSGPLVETFLSAAATLGLRRRVRLFVDPQRTIPLAWGIWRPRLILPAEAATWDSERCRAVLLHELAHVKRGDLVVLLLTQVACIFHWFNPFVWVAAWRLHLERERACDDLVLATGVKASAYAEHLLHVATRLDAGTPIGALAMARPSRLEGRLLALLNSEINRSTPTTRVVALFFVALAVLLVPLAMLRGADQKTGGEPEQPREPDRQAVVPLLPPPKEATPPAAGNQAIASPKTIEEKQIAGERPVEAGAKEPGTIPMIEPGRNNASDGASPREIDLLNREIELAAEQFRRASKGYEAGQMSMEQVVRQQRELSLLKIEQARIKHDFAALEKAIREQMDLVTTLRMAQEKRVEVGVDTGDSILTLQRELLRLERELAAANAGRRGASQNVPAVEAALEEQQQREQLRKAESELESLLAKFHPSHPVVKKMQERIADLKGGGKGPFLGAGRPERRREIAISAPKAGIVHQVLVREGDKIKSGERLLVFDDRQAKVKLETARAQLEAAKAGLKLEEIAVQGASAELERTKEITAARLAPQAEANTRQRGLDAAQASLAKAAAEYAVVEQQLRQAELELELLTILSPKNGTILQVNILEGEHTSPTNDPLILIGD